MTSIVSNEEEFGKSKSLSDSSEGVMSAIEGKEELSPSNCAFKAAISLWAIAKSFLSSGTPSSSFTWMDVEEYKYYKKVVRNIFLANFLL